MWLGALLERARRPALFASFGVAAFLVSEAIVTVGYDLFGKHLIVLVEALAAFLSVTFGFVLNEKVTMRNVGKHGGGAVGFLVRLAKYQLVYLLGNAISVGLQLALLYWLGISPSFGNILGSAAALPANYLVSSRVVWGVGASHKKATKRVSSELGLVLGLVCVAAILRITVLLSSPSLLAVGDAAEHVALARELAQNHYLVPSKNTLYYPGTPWIYPPLALELLASLCGLAGWSGWTPFYVVSGLMVVFDSLTVVPAYLAAKEAFDGRTALAAGLLFAAYPPGIYALSWGAYPQIVASFMVMWLLWLWVGDRQGLKRGVAMGFVAGLVALTHDLTAFVVVGALLAYTVGGALWGLRRRGLPARAKTALVALLLCLPFMAYWYVPRLQWVLYAASVSSPPQALLLDTKQFLKAFAIPIGVYYSYALFYVVLLVVSAYTLVRRFRASALPLIVFGLVPLCVMVYRSSDVALLERLPYYVLLPTTLFAARGLSFTAKGLGDLVPAPAAKRVTALVVVGVFAAFTALSAVTYSATAHTYYARCDYCSSGTLLPELQLYGWILKNTPPGSVFAAAGQLGYYIAAYDGRPTIAYHPLYYLTQPSERYESLAAYRLVFEPANNTAITLSYIVEFNVSYVVVYNDHGVVVPEFYVPVYSDSVVTVYRVGFVQAGQG